MMEKRGAPDDEKRCEGEFKTPNIAKED